MLLYMYSADPFSVFTDSANSQLLGSANLYTLADKYMIPTLKSHISDHFTNCLRTVTEMDHSPPIRALTKLLAAVFEGTPKTDLELRDKLLVHMLANRKKFLGRRSVKMYARHNHDFALHLLHCYMAEAHSDAADKFLYWCPTCKRYTSRSLLGSCNHGHKLLDWTRTPEFQIR